MCIILYNAAPSYEYLSFPFAASVSKKEPCWLHCFAELFGSVRHFEPHLVIARLRQ